MTDRVLPSSPGGRIELLFKHSDVSKEQLEQALDLPVGVTFRHVVSGEYPLSPTDLVAVADVLDVPVTVLTGELPMDGHLGVSLRLGAVEAADVPSDALQYADVLLRYRALIDSWLGRLVSPLAGVDMSTDRYFMAAGEESARRVRDALALGDEPINDLVTLVEQLGYPVVYRELPVDMHGLNVRDMREGPTTRVIVVSTRGPWTQQRYTLAHELCHALYDDDGQVIVDLVDVPDRLPELRAECFARHLLLPHRGLASDAREARRDGVNSADLTAQLIVRWGVSRTAVLRALEDDGLVEPEQIAELRTRPLARLIADAGLADTWQALTVDQSAPSSSPWLLDRALEAYRQGWIEAHVIAGLLDQDVAFTERQLAAQGWR